MNIRKVFYLSFLIISCGADSSSPSSNKENNNLEKIVSFTCGYGTGFGLPGGSDISFDSNTGLVVYTTNQNATADGNSTRWLITGDYLNEMKEELDSLDFASIDRT